MRTSLVRDLGLFGFLGLLPLRFAEVPRYTGFRAFGDIVNTNVLPMQLIDDTNHRANQFVTVPMEFA